MTNPAPCGTAAAYQRTMISRYTVHLDGRHDPLAVRDRLHGCLSEWEMVADVHVTAGDGRYDVTVDWDTTAPDWPDEHWPMHAADALGRAAERVAGVTDAAVVCHDRPEPVVLEIDTTPPRPPYELDRPGNQPESNGDAMKPPTPTPSTPGRSSAASGVTVAEKRTVLPHGCNCGARWAGSNTAHCGACHVTLSSVTAFDRHRRGGECHDPTEVGLVRIDRAGYHVWGWPPRDEEPTLAERMGATSG